MASRKEYAVDFVLNAAMNGGFKGVFNQAQQEFVRLGAEIKNIQALQRDISAYQRQEQAIQKTKEKLENLGKQLETVDRQMQETTGSTAALEREKLKLAQRITATEDALKKQEDRLGEVSRRLGDAGISASNMGEKSAELSERLKELKRQQEEAAKAAQDFADGGTRAVDQLASALASAGITNGIKEIGAAWLDCVKTEAEFERAMSAVEAIAGTTEEEFASLSDKAKELGATTVFTAQQTAEAMEYTAMAGWNASEMMDGMSGIMDLAAASGEDLAMVSDIVTDSLTAFGLTAKDTAHYADVLAQAAASSNTNVKKMGNTFQYAAPLAGALGFSIEDVAVMTGLMANNGIKANKAGTAMRTMFSKLLDGATLTGRAFGEMNIETQNADGSMRGLRAVMRDLRGGFAQMTQAEKLMNAESLVGRYALTGFVSLMNSTDEDFDELAAKIDDCAGAAHRMAETRLDNLSGDVTLLKSAWEGLKITIGEEFEPELRGVVQTGTEGLTVLNGFVKENPALVKGIMTTVGSIGAMTAGVTGLSAAVKLFKALDIGSTFGSALPVIGWAGAAIAGLTGAYVMLKTDWDAAVESANELDAAADSLNRTLEETNVQSIEASVNASAAAAQDYLVQIEELGAVQERTTEQEYQYQSALAGILKVAPELSEFITQTADKYGNVTYAVEGSTAAIWDNIEAIRQQSMMRALQEDLESIYAGQAETLREINKSEARRKEIIGTLPESAYERWRELRKSTQSPTNDTEAAALKLQQEELEALELQYGNTFDQIVYFDQEIDQGKAAVEASQKEADLLRGTIKGLAGEMDAGAEEGDDLAESMKGIGEASAEAKELGADYFYAIEERAQALSKEYDKLYESMSNAVNGRFDLWEKNKDTITASNLDDFIAAQKSQFDYFNQHQYNAQVIRDAFGTFAGLERLEAAMAGDLSKEGVNKYAALAEAVKAFNNALAAGDETAAANVAGKIREAIDMFDKNTKEKGDLTDRLMEGQRKKLGGEFDELRQTALTGLEGLTLTDEAREAGEKTVQALIDGAEKMHGPLVDKYLGFAGDIAAILQSIGLDGEVVHTPTPEEAWRTRHTQAFASGTGNAPPGWAWVGEEGPELLRMRGGEQVLPSGFSRSVAQAWSDFESLGSGPRYAAGNQSVQVTFNIEGSATDETVERMELYGDRFAERVLEVVQEANEDYQRRRF